MNSIMFYTCSRWVWVRSLWHKWDYIVYSCMSFFFSLLFLSLSPYRQFIFVYIFLHFSQFSFSHSLRGFFICEREFSLSHPTTFFFFFFSLFSSFLCEIFFTSFRNIAKRSVSNCHLSFYSSSFAIWDTSEISLREIFINCCFVLHWQYFYGVENELPCGM